MSYPPYTPVPPNVAYPHAQCRFYIEDFNRSVRANPASVCAECGELVEIHWTVSEYEEDGGEEGEEEGEEDWEEEEDDNDDEEMESEEEEETEEQREQRRRREDEWEEDEEEEEQQAEVRTAPSAARAYRLECYKQRITCYTCGQQGHYSYECEERE